MPDPTVTITGDVLVAIKLKDSSGKLWTAGGVLGNLAVSEDGGESIPVLFLQGNSSIESVNIGTLDSPTSPV